MSATRGLLELCKNKEWDSIQSQLLQKHLSWDFMERDSTGNTPILICAIEGALNILQSIHNMKPSYIDFEVKNKRGKTIMLLTCEHGHYDLLKWLIGIGGSIGDLDIAGNSCLLLASKNGYFSIVNWLLQNGCSLSDKNVFGDTSLHLAASAGSLEILKLLLFGTKFNIDIRNEDGLSCIHKAIEAGQNETVKFLLKVGGNYQAKNKLGDSCILTAAKNRNLELVQLLYEYGASLDDINKGGNNCILIASYNGDLQLLKYLVENGCSLQDSNSSGTCIINAARYRKLGAILWMLQNGSSIDEKIIMNDRTIVTCEDIIKKNGLYEQVKKAFTTKSSRK